ncbi:MAG TPA: Mpo1-like protein, partial [Bacteroidia bacterium]|nr:Mpo1-like protein [Bacteroidia bacterium]
MKSINEWLSDYGESHQNPMNKKVHFICVPLIFFSLVGLLYNIKLTYAFGIEITLAHLMTIVVIIYYFFLSVPIAIGMILYSAFCLTFCYIIEQSIGH